MSLSSWRRQTLLAENNHLTGKAHTSSNPAPSSGESTANLAFGSASQHPLPRSACNREVGHLPWVCR
jgi:hypothetical protein